MPLAAVPLDSHPRIIVDWLEFSVICSPYNLAQVSHVKRAWDTRRNTEDSDFEGDSSTTEDAFLESVFEEIRLREEMLNGAYPFGLSDSGEEFFLKADLTPGGVSYLFCLFFSHVGKDEVLDGTLLPNVTFRERDLFQVCSTLAAAGAVSGSSIAFGFPRPDGSNFLDKLREVYQLFGEGKVREHPLPGATSSPKDDGVDVIAWSPNPDNSPGKYYLMGQVASGGNWPGKSLKGVVEKFHDTWFEVKPASTPNPSLFIPFHISAVGDESLDDTLLVLTYQFGSVFYRLRIPKLIDKGFAIFQENLHTIERTNEFEHVEAWVMATCEAYKNRGRELEAA